MFHLNFLFATVIDRVILSFNRNPFLYFSIFFFIVIFGGIEALRYGHIVKHWYDPNMATFGNWFQKR